MAAQRCQHARRNEKTRGCNRFGNRTTAALAHVEYDLVNALFFRVEKTIANFIRPASVEGRQAQNQDIGVGFLDDNLRRGHLGADKIDFLRRSLPAPDHSNLDSRAGLAVEKIHGLANGHVARSEPADGLENVAAANARLRARTIRQHGKHDDVAIPLAQCQAGFASAGIGELLFVLVVFAGSEVAGLRVEGLQHPVQGAGCDRAHVGIVDIVLLNFLQNFAVHRERLVRFVVRRAAQDVPDACVTKDRY